MEQFFCIACHETHIKNSEDRIFQTGYRQINSKQILQAGYCSISCKQANFQTASFHKKAHSFDEYTNNLD